MDQKSAGKGEHMFVGAEVEVPMEVPVEVEAEAEGTGIWKNWEELK